MSGKWWLGFLGVAVLAGFGHRWLILLGWLALWGGAYWYSFVFKPQIPCSKCHGTGMTGHKILPWAGLGICSKCHGQKMFPRLGVRIFQPERARQLSR